MSLIETSIEKNGNVKPWSISNSISNDKSSISVVESKPNENTHFFASALNVVLSTCSSISKVNSYIVNNVRNIKYMIDFNEFM